MARRKKYQHTKALSREDILCVLCYSYCHHYNEQ